MSDIPFAGEVSNSKLAAVFDTVPLARAAVAAVIARTGLQPAQVKLVAPDEPNPGTKLEPEGRGILRTIVFAHVWFGIAGLVVGAAVFGVMLWYGMPLIASSPGIAAVAFVFFGAIAGLMLGGLISLRPDHDRYILATQEAMTQQRTTVVVHALSGDQADQAADILSGLGGEVTKTL